MRFSERGNKRRRRKEGFKLIELKTGADGILAHAAQKEGPRVGKYKVNLSDLDKFSSAIDCKTCDLIIIDEVGPMELHSEKCISAVQDAFESENNVIATIHYKSKHPLVQALRQMKAAAAYEINELNRNSVLEEILRNLHE